MLIHKADSRYFLLIAARHTDCNLCVLQRISLIYAQCTIQCACHKKTFPGLVQTTVWVLTFTVMASNHRHSSFFFYKNVQINVCMCWAFDRVGPTMCMNMSPMRVNRSSQAAMRDLSWVTRLLDSETRGWGRTDNTHYVVNTRIKVLSISVHTCTSPWQYNL